MLPQIRVVLVLSLWTCRSNNLISAQRFGDTLIRRHVSRTTYTDRLAEILIVGGERARCGEFPWLVNLRIDGAFCGGALVDWDLILTAAHCVTTEKGKVVTASKIDVVAGDCNLDQSSPNKQRISASGVRRHSQFNIDSLKNDIALIRTKKPFEKTQYVSLVNLPTSGATGSRAIVAGWGSTYYGGDVSPRLNKVELPIVTDDTCRGIMTYPGGQFCAGSTGKDSCQGDSGSPLICNVGSETVCGIVSFGYGCGLPGNPGVYTKVYSYLPWIKDNFCFSTSIRQSINKLIVILLPLLVLKRNVGV